LINFEMQKSMAFFVRIIPCLCEFQGEVFAKPFSTNMFG
jgi:hypothetical protein